ncbi:MAG: hypothetical protein LBR53_01835 [Deltaproteobacteria bacterium]|jgi:hypothetical protein|nr:hypothetical protein [Deltaproteobacteria bacterium]
MDKENRDRYLRIVEENNLRVRKLELPLVWKFNAMKISAVIEDVSRMNSSSVDALERIAALGPVPAGPEEERFSEAARGTEACVLYASCLAGDILSAGTVLDAVLPGIRPDLREAFEVKALSFLIFNAAMRGDLESAEKAFARVRGRKLGWELAAARAAAAFDLLCPLASLGAHERALSYGRIVSSLAESLRDHLAREGVLHRLRVPMSPLRLAKLVGTRILARDFPFELAAGNAPPLAEPDPDALLRHLDGLIQMKFDELRILANNHYLPQGLAFELKERFINLSEFSSTASDYARLAYLGRDLILLSIQFGRDPYEAEFYLDSVMRFWDIPEAAVSFADASRMVVEALVSRGRFKRADQVARQALSLPDHEGTADLKAEAVNALVRGPAFFESLDGESFPLLERISGSLSALRDSPAVNLAQLRVESYLLPFYLGRGDNDRILETVTRINENPDASLAGYEFRLAANANLVIHHSRHGRLGEALKLFHMMDTEMNTEPPFRLSWGCAATDLCLALSENGQVTEALAIAEKVGRYANDPDLEGCLARLKLLTGDVYPGTSH